MADSWAARWAAEWQAAARVNPYHVGGGPTGGQFTNPGGTGGARNWDQAGARPAAAAKPAGDQNRQAAQLRAQANADRKQARQLEAQLRALEAQIRAASAAAKHAHAAAKHAAHPKKPQTAKQAAAAAKRKTAAHSTHHHHQTLQQKAAGLRRQIRVLREQARQLDARAAGL